MTATLAASSIVSVWPSRDLTIRFWPSSLSTVPRMRVGVPAGGVWAKAGPTARAMRAAIAIFLIIQIPLFPFSRGDSQEMAHPLRSFRSHSGERRRSGRAVRKARSGNPSSTVGADIGHLVCDDQMMLGVDRDLHVVADDA